MDPIARLLVELGAIFLGLSFLVALAHRLRLSPIPMFLLAGLAFGQGGILSLSGAEGFVDVAAEIGVILLLLTLGLEFSAPELIQSLRLHAPSGVVDFIFSAIPGFAAALLLGMDWQAAVVLGGVTWISSSGIIARLLDDLDRLGNRETPAVLSVLVLEDLAMAVYLPLVVVLLSGGTPGQAVLGVGLAVLAVVLVLVAAHRVGPRLGRAVTRLDDEQVLLRLFGITLLVAGVAQGLDASAAVGAFLVGIALTGEAADRAREVFTPLRDLFAATFFVAFGLSVDPAEIWPVLPPALALAAVTAATKIAVGWYAARRSGVATRGRIRAGTALVARGEFSIVIAGLAVAAGFGEVGPLATAYVLILAIAGPVLTRYADSISSRFIGRGPTPEPRPARRP